MEKTENTETLLGQIMEITNKIPNYLKGILSIWSNTAR
jgi:hypothetical protein